MISNYSILTSWLGVLPSALSATLGLIVGRLWDSRNAASKKQARIGVQYLSQLQVDVGALIDRLRYAEPEKRQKHYSDCPDYFVESTAFAIGRVLARELLLIEHGIYAELHGKLRTSLYSLRIDPALKGLGFHRYERLAFAEVLISSSKVSDQTA